MRKRTITLFVNGEEHTVTVDVEDTLAQVIRNQLNLTDVKHCCGRGECGACTVQVDDERYPTGKKAINSCLVLASMMHGKRIHTIGSLEKGGTLHPVQEAFIEQGAVQCGFCSSGMIMKTVDILENNPRAGEAEIRQGLEGNICRCTGYTKIVAAAKQAGRVMATGK
jgi:aerobic-type carbon monoxide dehydrogenase small subunit (CoxS/CutS family)